MNLINQRTSRDFGPAYLKGQTEPQGRKVPVPYPKRATTCGTVRGGGG